MLTFIVNNGDVIITKSNNISTLVWIMLDDNQLKMALNPIGFQGCYLNSYPCSFYVLKKFKEKSMIYNHNYNTSNN
jgi:hypothetical protein